ACHQPQDGQSNGACRRADLAWQRRRGDRIDRDVRYWPKVDIGNLHQLPLSAKFAPVPCPVRTSGAAMRRRDFIKVIGGAATWPLAARAQQIVHMRHIGILLYAKEDRVIISPVLSALESLGYVDGKTVSIEYRDADGRYERLQEAANEIVRLKPDVIFSFGG